MNLSNVKNKELAAKGAKFFLPRITLILRIKGKYYYENTFWYTAERDISYRQLFWNDEAVY